MRRNGFTLVEMMVALAIFSIIAVGALGLLRFSVDAELSSRAHTDRIAAERRFLAVWNGDLGQASPRAVRDQAGATQPAIEAVRGGDGGLVLRLTRSGWSNPDGSARPGLQRVEYRWKGGQLLRAAYPFPDGSTVDEGVPVAPMPAAPTLRFRNTEGAWVDEWRPEQAEALPAAIEASFPQASGPPLVVITLVGAIGK